MSNSCDLTPYGEVADLIEKLPMLVREKRRRERLSLQAAGAQLGVAASTVLRFESGQGGIATESVVAMFRWLDGGRA